MILLKFKYFFDIFNYLKNFSSILVNNSSVDKIREKTKIPPLNIAGPSTTTSPKASSKKKMPNKNNKGKDSGTSSEEERWLDAIESGKLEEV